MNNDELLQEIHRLTLENNRQLHKMRRAAFWSRLFSFIIYAALLIAPLYFYMQYLSPIVDKMFKAYEQLQGNGAQASAQFTDFQNAWQQFEQRFGAASSTR